MIYTIGGLSIHLEDQGVGELALVFLHYWGGTSRTWSRVIDSLKGDFRCIAYDQRGWGKSDKPSEGYALSDLADEAQSLIKAKGLTKYVLVGHSMGGKISQLLASRRPAGLVALILVAPAPPTPVHFPDAAREQQIHAYDNRETALQAIGFLTARLPASEIIEQIVEDSLGGSNEAKLAWPTAAILEDISSRVGNISVPTLILAGENDMVDSIEQHRGEVVPRIPNARLEVIRKSGHLSPIDEPEQLAVVIREFLSALE